MISRPFQMRFVESLDTYLVGIEYMTDVRILTEQKKQFDTVFNHIDALALEGNIIDITNLRRSLPMMPVYNFSIYAYDNKPKKFRFLEENVNWFKLLETSGMERNIFQTLDAYSVLHYSFSKGFNAPIGTLICARGRYEMEAENSSMETANPGLQARLTNLLHLPQSDRNCLSALIEEYNEWFPQVREAGHLLNNGRQFIREINGKKMIIVSRVHYERLQTFIEKGEMPIVLNWEAHLRTRRGNFDLLQIYSKLKPYLS